MKDKKNLFDLNPPDTHIVRVGNAVEGVLSTRRRAERRRWLPWLAVPALASFSAVFIWNKNKEKDMSPSKMETALFLDIDQELDFEVVANINELEDLDLLEDWDEYEDA